MNRGPIYTQLYFSFFGYFESDVIICECCPSVAVDIHHINSRGMGGTKKKETIKDIMALCRDCHERYGDKRQYLKSLKDIHYKKIINHLSQSIR